MLAWLMGIAITALAGDATIAEAYPPPSGYTLRSPGSFGTWLENRRLAPPSDPIRTFDGRIVSHPGRVVRLPLVKGDLQQCADSAIRLRAEWLRANDLPVVFHATSGDPIPWHRYARGERARAVGNRLSWSNDGSGTWESWLRAVMMWAGTASLVASDTVADTQPDAGDIIVQGGFPGHAVVILRVATRGDDTLLLLGEGYMPAQDFHVEHGPVGGWWRWETETGLPNYHYPLRREHLRRWK